MWHSWVKTVERVMATRDELWLDEHAGIRARMVQDEVLTARLHQLHAEVVAVERRPRRRDSDGTPNCDLP